MAGSVRGRRYRASGRGSLGNDERGFPEVPSVQQTKVTQTKTAGETPKADKSDASKAKEGKAVAAAIRHFPLTDEERAKLGPNEGIVEIVVGKNHSVSIDGEEKGRGPVLRCRSRRGKVVRGSRNASWRAASSIRARSSG